MCSFVNDKMINNFFKLSDLTVLASDMTTVAQAPRDQQSPLTVRPHVIKDR
jgi:hypothetical protein